jgi:hypothetical protein
LSETHLQKKLDALEDALQTANKQRDQANSDTQAANREMNLIKAIWKKEQEKWKRVEEKMKNLDPESISQPPSPVRLTSPTILDSSPVSDITNDHLDSVILGEIQAMRDFQSQQQNVIERLEREKAQVFGLLEEERKLSTLLTAEVDSLPDYIFMYPQERK